MSWLFGRRKSPAELLRENKRMIDRAIRDLDRERLALAAQEKKTVLEIKRCARDGQLAHVAPRVGALLHDLVPEAARVAVPARRPSSPTDDTQDVRHRGLPRQRAG